jgi:hypothetical protein
MSQPGRSLQVIDAAKNIRRVCEPDAVDPQEFSLEYRPSGAISVINSRIADNTGVSSWINTHRLQEPPLRLAGWFRDNRQLFVHVECASSMIELTIFPSRRSRYFVASPSNS